jgi:hypothetical protein
LGDKQGSLEVTMKSPKFIEAREYRAKRLGITPDELARQEKEAVRESPATGTACLDPLEVERIVTVGPGALPATRLAHLDGCVACVAEVEVASNPAPDDLGLRARDVARVAAAVRRLGEFHSPSSVEPAAAIAMRLATCDSLAYALDLVRSRPTTWQRLRARWFGSRHGKELDAIRRNVIQSVFLALEAEAALVSVGKQREARSFQKKYAPLVEDMRERVPDDLREHLPRILAVR